MLSPTSFYFLPTNPKVSYLPRALVTLPSYPSATVFLLILPPLFSLASYVTILYLIPDTLLMDTFTLEYCKGCWLVPLEVIDELYDALLRLPANGRIEYITLGSQDSDVEICCAANPKRFVKEPFAYTEAEAHTKLSAWREKSESNECDRSGNDRAESPTLDSTGEKTTASKPIQDSSEPSFAANEAEAIRCLRERGYTVAPPRASTSNLGSITPPPPYTLHLSSSQPVRSVARSTDTAASTDKRKRGDDDSDDSDDRMTARATSCPSTPIRGFDNDNVAARACDTNGEPEIREGDADADDDEEEEEVVSAPQRKRRKTTRTAKTSTLQKPTALLRCMKTKKGTLTSTISYEATAELTSVALETVDTSPTNAENDAENDTDMSDSVEGRRPAAGEGGQIVRSGDLLHVLDPPPTSTPEEIGALNLLSLSISAPSTPPPGLLPMDEDEDSLFIPQEPSAAMRSPSSEDVIGLSQDKGSEEPLAEERRLHRHFCEDVCAVEGRWDHSSTIKGMAVLRQKDPQLRATFQKCLAIARQTMDEGVVHC